MSATLTMKKLTISVSSEFYEGLLRTAGQRKIGSFIERNLSDKVATKASLEAGYKAMAQDEEYNQEANEWVAISGRL